VSEVLLERGNWGIHRREKGAASSVSVSIQNGWNEANADAVDVRGSDSGS